MKGFCITLLSLAIIILSAVGVYAPNNKVNEEYLRIHIRANSNDEIDQKIKYKVKEEIVTYLTPIVAECNSKKRAEIELTSRLEDIEKIVDQVLSSSGYDYKSRAQIKSENFPTRVYDAFTLESGYYDALIINLGKGEGDNWWCVVYPPLCFVDSGSGYVYKSKILEIIKNFFND